MQRPLESAFYETIASDSWAKLHLDGTRTIPGQGFGVHHDCDGRGGLPGGHPEPRPNGPSREYQHDAAAVRLLERLMETQEKE